MKLMQCLFIKYYCLHASLKLSLLVGVVSLKLFFLFEVRYAQKPRHNHFRTLNLYIFSEGISVAFPETPVALHPICPKKKITRVLNSNTIREQIT